MAASSDAVVCPVRARNTSSSEGRRSVMSTTLMPASSSRRTVSTRLPAPPSTGSDTRCVPRSTLGRSEPTSASSSTTGSRSAPSTVTSRTSPASRCFSSVGVPWAMTAPWSITTTSDASWSASSRYCVVRRMVAPSFTRSRRYAHRSRRFAGSRPVVGSSSRSTRGRATSPAPRSTRRRMPPEYVLSGRSAASASDTRSSTSVARSAASLFDSRDNRPTISRFSRPVNVSSTAAYCPARPMQRRTAVGCFTTSKPATRALPASGSSRVDRMRTRVVLPAPFGPSSATTPPSGTERSTPASAFVSPNDRAMPSTSTIAFMCLPFLGARRSRTSRRRASPTRCRVASCSVNAQSASTIARS